MSIPEHNSHIDLPITFEELVAQSLPLHKQKLLDTIREGRPPVSIRINPLKDAALSYPTDPVLWCANGRYLQERPLFTLDPLFHAGAYYVQEASSMILHLVLQSLPIKSEPAVLDLCAAPGGKSTLLLDWLKGRGHLVANEVIKSRVNVLEENIIKWGYPNAIVTNNDPADFSRLTSAFDLILVDAPCSGEGMFRKDSDAIAQWSTENVNLCSSRQKRILDDIVPSLNEGGYLIYSTCTFNERENMENVQYLVNTHNLSNVVMPWAAEKGAVVQQRNGLEGYQMVPGFVQGEGFFFAVFRKPGEPSGALKSQGLPKLRLLSKSEANVIKDWFQPGISDHLFIHENGDVYYFSPHLTTFLGSYLHALRVKYSGVKAGQLNKNIFIPDHALAMCALPLTKKPRVNLDVTQALKYLNKSLHAIESPEQSWVLMTFQGLALGWAKNLGNRINNYLPSQLRIQMDITDK